MRVRASAACCLLLAACATVRPDFERHFNTAAHTGRPHDLWMQLLDMRYGCDTVFVKARSQPSVQSGMSACDLAGLVTPEVIRAWYTPTGLREEWLYRTYNGAGLSTVFLEGPNQRELRVKTTAR